MPVSEIRSVSGASGAVGAAGAAAPADSGFSAVLSKTLNSSAVDLDDIFDRASRKYGVSVKLLKAVAGAESNFNPNATSGCGAMGVMQLMPGTAKGLGVTDAYDPEQNIMGGAKYLSGLLAKFGGNTGLAVAAYNAGPGSVEKYGGVPPYSETQAYVKKVLASCGEVLTAGTASSVQESAGTASPMSAIVSSLLSAAGSDEKDDPLTALMLMTLYEMQMSDHNDIFSV